MTEKIFTTEAELSPLERIAATIRAHRLRRGWSPAELARCANVSRTTLHHLERAQTSRPQAAILRRIAHALELPDDWPESEFQRRRSAGDSNAAGVRAASRSVAPPPRSPREALDRATNPLVAEVADERPELFRGWSEGDWSELYSNFGAGGALTREGVVECARRIERRRATIRKLEVILDTHLEEVAAGVVDALYKTLEP